MLDRTLFALGFGVGLPALLIAAGADLHPNRLAAWGVVGFTFGWAIPTALDWLFQWGRADEISLIRSRDANSEFTEAKAAEIRARIEIPVTAAVTAPEYDDAKAGEVETFFRAGENAGGFSIRRLKDVVGSTTWTRLVHFYSSEPGWNILFDYGGDDGYRLSEKWTVEMVLTELGAGHFPLPPFAVRDIRPYVRDTTRQNATKQVEAIG